jgi:hypothetical protein
MTLGIDIQHNIIEFHYAECHDYLNYMLSVIRLNVVMLSVVMLSDVVPLTNEPHKLECLYLAGLSNPD